MSRKICSIWVIALTAALMLGNISVYAYWVDKIQSDWVVSMTREITIKVINFSTKPQEESASDALHEESSSKGDEESISESIEIDPHELSLSDDRTPPSPHENDAEDNELPEVETDILTHGKGG